jgi:sortase A
VKTPLDEELRPRPGEVGQKTVAARVRRPFRAQGDRLKGLLAPEDHRVGTRGHLGGLAEADRKKRERRAGLSARALAISLPLRSWRDARQAAPAVPSPARTEHRVLLVGLAISTVGLCLLLFVGYAFVFSGYEEARVQHQLLNNFTGPGAGALLTGKIPSEGQPAAVLDIPAIGLEAVVVEGTSSLDLMKGPGLMMGTAEPGTKGNAVIAGRRATAGAPFASLPSLQTGDRITVTTGLGKFKYRVVDVGTVAAGSPDPIAPSPQALLTLVTSNPPIESTGRAYVVAELKSAPAVAPVPHGSPPVVDRGLSGDPSAIWPSFFWSAVFAGVLVATMLAYRRWRSAIWAVYVLTTPVIVAVALVWFESVFRLLPATL